MKHVARRTFIKQTGILCSGILISPSISSLANTTMTVNNQYDVIIIGGSYAGLAAAMALGRALRKVMVIDGGNPCNKQTPYSHNFLTRDGVPPAEIAMIAREQVGRYPTVQFLHQLATTARQTENGFEVHVGSGEIFNARKLVFASGIKDIMPAVPGFSESWGISVLHCPYCHGYEMKHKKTGIYANGDNAFELAMLISNWTHDLTVYTNGPSAFSDEQTEILKKYNLPVVETEIRSFEQQNGHVRNILFVDGAQSPVDAIYARLPFEQHCSIPESLGCELTEEGYIKINPAHKTTVAGVFACGDNATRMRTVANAVAMGTTTGIMLNKELIEERFNLK